TNTASHGGRFSALLGSPGVEISGDSSIYQAVYIPGPGYSLSFWYKGATTDSITFDWQDAYIQDSVGTNLATIFHLAATIPNWTLATVDLTPYANRIIRIAFLVHGDNAGDPTSLNVDDVAILGPGTGICCRGATCTIGITQAACT